jgi:hypothetical protein
MAQYIEDYIGGVRQTGLNTLVATDFSGAPSVALPAATTINGSTVTSLGSITSTSATAFTVASSGTNYGLQIDESTASAITGLKIKAAATGNGVALSSLGGTNELMTLDGKGTGTVGINTISTTSGLVTIGNTTSLAGATVNGPLTGHGTIKSNTTGGVGYATGAGGTVTQASSRTTGVTVNAPTGAITLVSAAGSATPASFTVTNSAVAATDVIIVNQSAGTDLYEIFVTNIAAGSFKITSFTTGGTTTEQPVFNFAVIKGVTS